MDSMLMAGKFAQDAASKALIMESAQIFLFHEGREKGEGSYM